MTKANWSRTTPHSGQCVNVLLSFSLTFKASVLRGLQCSIVVHLWDIKFHILYGTGWSAHWFHQITFREETVGLKTQVITWVEHCSHLLSDEENCREMIPSFCQKFSPRYRRNNWLLLKWLKKNYEIKKTAQESHLQHKRWFVDQRHTGGATPLELFKD